MAHHYGYIKRTESEADGDHIDVFLGPRPESEIVFVIDQNDAKGKFDEHKCMLGFVCEKDAKEGYLASYSPGWTGLASIKPMTMDRFKTWIKEGDTAKPAIGQRDYVRPNGALHYDTSRRKGPGDPSHAGAFAPAGQGVQFPGAVKPRCLSRPWRRDRNRRS